MITLEELIVQEEGPKRVSPRAKASGGGTNPLFTRQQEIEFKKTIAEKDQIIKNLEQRI
jgi:hypothetical protein